MPTCLRTCPAPLGSEEPTTPMVRSTRPRGAPRMTPTLEESFMTSSKWQALSPAARSTLCGILQFATRRHCDWVVEGTPKQLGDWIGPEANIEPSHVVIAIRELSTAGCLR